MAIKALSGFTPYWYTPKSEKDDPNPTRFKLCKLDGEQLGDLRPEIFLLSGGRVEMTGRGITMALLYGLVDWERFNDDKGPVRFDVSNFRLINNALRIELATELVNVSTLDEDKRKN